MAEKKKQNESGVPGVKKLLEVGAHFGHAVRRWNPKMKRYIYDTRKGVHIFDLFKTKEKLEEVCEFMEESASQGKSMVFVGTKGQAVDVIKENAENLGVSYVVNRWVGGTITNWEQISKSIERLVEMREKMEKGEYDKYTKKEQVIKRREIERLERMYGGLVGLEDIPDLIFVVDPKREKVAVKEANDRDVTVVVIADSNADPSRVDYLIPANDDALKSVTLLVETVAGAVERGVKKKKKQKKGKKQ